jgi:hypothetical protein
MPAVRNHPLAISVFDASLKCASCEVFIGIGHFDATPVLLADGSGPYCRACSRAELRRRRPGWRTVAWAE